MVAALIRQVRKLPATLRRSLTKAPPPTRTDNVKEVLHGVEIVDPYRWLEDQSSPETRAWIDAQNSYTKPFLEVEERMCCK